MNGKEATHSGASAGYDLESSPKQGSVNSFGTFKNQVNARAHGKTSPSVSGRGNMRNQKATKGQDQLAHSTKKHSKKADNLHVEEVGNPDDYGTIDRDD